jgi:hypothetical protein
VFRFAFDLATNDFAIAAVSDARQELMACNRGRWDNFVAALMQLVAVLLTTT